ncbi:patatin-like phospholipase family protein [Salinisphaera hydrothermalis]|uniref:patatin-like phospholipase family protein n=1 Tax=Salinisphaera hydrothermalis TaxID=563188 RepID=UPI0033410F75
MVYSTTSGRPGGPVGLVLTAGGARGAYQAGVLKRIGERMGHYASRSPFAIVAGASAGAINGAAVAAYSDRFSEGTLRLALLWSALTAEQVYRTDLRAIFGNAVRAGLDFGLGAWLGAGRVAALLDAAPLRALLMRELPLDGIGRAIERGDLSAIAITASGYHSGISYIFVQGAPGHPVWRKSRRIVLPAEITVDHICASAAIPLVFPPVALSTGVRSAWFGDGAMRLTHPLSPAIRLGAERILAIGVRCAGTAETLAERETEPGTGEQASMPRRPPLAQIMGVFLNAIFLDHLDADLDHLMRMNAFVKTYESATGERPAQSDLVEPMRVVEPLVVSPSVDLAEIADELSYRMPRTLRLALSGLGEPDPRSADLNSYLLFEPEYARALIDIGYHDASDRIDEIEAFLMGEAPAVRPAATAIRSRSVRS